MICDVLFFVKNETQIGPYFIDPCVPYLYPRDLLYKRMQVNLGLTPHPTPPTRPQDDPIVKYCQLAPTSRYHMIVTVTQVT